MALVARSSRQANCTKLPDVSRRTRTTNPCYERDLRFHLERVRVGEGNRTPTISLGIRPIRPSDRADLGTRRTASDCQGP